VLSHTTAEGRVSVRLTEVEAYEGDLDPGSHAFRGRTKRTAVMFGPPGHLYTYFTYGMHTCCNIVCGPEGRASAVLLRAGEVVEGLELARSRRPGVGDRDLARGPARLVVALGVLLAENGADVVDGPDFTLTAGARGPVGTGPRTGVAGDGGGDAFPWRFFLPGEPTVSPYRRAARRRT
jgi:DNA-3-methyladenine glycosylase